MCVLTRENPFRILRLEPLREVQMVTCLLLMFLRPVGCGCLLSGVLFCRALKWTASQTLTVSDAAAEVSGFVYNRFDQLLTHTQSGHSPQRQTSNLWDYPILLFQRVRGSGQARRGL